MTQEKHSFLIVGQWFECLNFYDKDDTLGVPVCTLHLMIPRQLNITTSRPPRPLPRLHWKLGQHKHTHPKGW